MALFLASLKVEKYMFFSQKVVRYPAQKAQEAQNAQKGKKITQSFIKHIMFVKFDGSRTK
jgi:hypothetical protein